VLWDGLVKKAVGWFGKELYTRNLVKWAELSVDVYKASHAPSREQAAFKVSAATTGFSGRSETPSFSS
jgi:hypothetical protein